MVVNAMFPWLLPINQARIGKQFEGSKVRQKWFIVNIILKHVFVCNMCKYIDINTIHACIENEFDPLIVLLYTVWETPSHHNNQINIRSINYHIKWVVLYSEEDFASLLAYCIRSWKRSTTIEIHMIHLDETLTYL